MSFVESPQSDRLPWAALPPTVREGVASVLGSPVVSVVPRVGGFSPGVAAGVTLADGRRAFVKAVGTPLNPHTPELYRHEVVVQGWLPRVPWTPALLGSWDDGDWVALAYEYVDAPTVPVPWSASSLAAVAALVRTMHASLGPAPASAPPVSQSLEGGDAWRRWASSGPPEGAPEWAVTHLDALAGLEAGFAAASDGAALLHMDLRHDNLLVRGPDVWVVDWPWAARGAAWVDAVLLAVTVELYGGPPAPTVLPACCAEPVPVEALAAVLAALSGYFVPHGMLPAPPGLPYLRAVQARQGEITAAWLDTLRLW
ncbi:MAG TPA: hypothetical protein VGX28_16455 [Frankiaceae bacterium]|jgi:hypothetical protein|nr:hypothetical protein [Frankiaceae bacterium]